MERPNRNINISESLLRVIVLPSLVYPCFKLNIEQDEIHKAFLIKQATEWIELNWIVLATVEHLSTTASFFVPAGSPYIDSY